MRRYLIIIVFCDLDESGCLNTGSNPDVSYRKVNSSYFCIESGSPLFVFPDVIKRSDVKWVRWIIYFVFRIKGSDFLTHVHIGKGCSEKKLVDRKSTRLNSSH